MTVDKKYLQKQIKTQKHENAKLTGTNSDTFKVLKIIPIITAQNVCLVCGYINVSYDKKMFAHFEA